MQSDDLQKKLMHSPEFQALARRRTRMSFILSFIMLVIYFAYFFALGYLPDWMASRLFQQSSTSIGIWFSAFCVIFGVFISGIYTWWANTYFDKAKQELLQTLSSDAE